MADFSAGAPGADTYVSETANGEVMLRPAVGAEFAGGPALPAGWSGATWESQGGGAGGTAAVSGGSLHVNGAFASTDTTFGPGSSLEGVATFGAATFQHVALSDNFESVWAMFSTRGTTNQLFASTQFGSGVTDTPIPGSLVGSSHRYRIEWDLTEVRYFVDGSLVATHTGTFGPALRAAASDFTAGGPELAVDWMRVGPYPASGAFESRIFDAGQAVNWNQLSWIENTPAGTDISAQRPDRQHADPGRQLEQLRPDRDLGGLDRRQLQVSAVPRGAEHHGPESNAGADRGLGELHGRRRHDSADDRPAQPSPGRHRGRSGRGRTRRVQRADEPGNDR